MTARSLQEHIDSGDGLAHIANHARRLLQFQALLEAALPVALRAHVRVANFRLGKLLVHAANSAVAAKIRHLVPSLASDLSNKGTKVTQIEVRVQAKPARQLAPKGSRPVLPGNNQKQALTSLARNLPEGSPLKQALDDLLHSVRE